MSIAELAEEHVDVVVVGSGAAGLTGALVAALAGLRVVVVEKTDVIGGTSSISGGGVWIPANAHAGEAGIVDSPEDALAYLRAVVGDAGDDELLQAFVEHGREMIAMLEERAGLFFRAWPAVGGTTDYLPDLPGGRPGGRALDSGKVALEDVGEWADRIRFGPGSPWVGDKFDFYAKRMHTKPRSASTVHPGRAFVDVGHVEHTGITTFSHVAGGTALVVQLLRGCLNHGVRLFTESPATELITHDDRVVGVRVASEGEVVALYADRGVLMASGGFAHNDDMKRTYLNRYLDLSCEIEANQGDGQLMGARVGGRLANMADAWWMPMVSLGEDAGETQDSFSVREGRCLPHTMVVNQHGQRFINESVNYYNFCEGFGIKRGADSPRYAWLVFDSQANAKYAMFNGAPPPKGEKRAWLQEADTLEELAVLIEVDPDALRATAARFNDFARTGEDLDFRRGEHGHDIAWGDPTHTPNPSLGTIDVGPFYACRLRPGALATKGGLAINAAAEVLSLADGRPIPGLYAAGNASAGPVPYAYPGPGSTLGAAMTFGYVAALSMSGDGLVAQGSGGETPHIEREGGDA